MAKKANGTQKCARFWALNAVSRHEAAHDNPKRVVCDVLTLNEHAPIRERLIGVIVGLNLLVYRGEYDSVFSAWLRHLEQEQRRFIKAKR